MTPRPSTIRAMPAETDMRRIRATSEGSGLARPHAWESASEAPTLVNVYAKKPLPPLPRVQSSPLKGSPVPAPLNVRKRPYRLGNPSPRSSTSSSSSAASASAASSSSTTTSFSSSSSSSSSSGSSTSSRSGGCPKTETNTVSSSSPAAPTAIPTNFRQDVLSRSPNRQTGRRAVSTSAVRKPCSKKVLQLIGQDVDVMGASSAAPKRESYPCHSLKKKTSRSSSSGSSSSRAFDLVSSNLHMVSRIPEEDAVPGLEADADGASSHHNSMQSMLSPVCITPGPSTHDRSFQEYECDGTQYCCCPLHLADAAIDADEFIETDVLGEYHKFAAELAASSETSTAALPAHAEAAESRVKRMSNFLSFSANAQFSRRRNRPNSIDPAPRPSSRRPPSSGPSAAPVPFSVSEEPELSPPENFPRPRTGVPSLDHAAAAAAAGEMRPHSAFDADSEDERKSRSRWRRDRDRGGRDESLRPRAWSKTGDQMRDLLTSAKDKARGLPTSKAEKRREMLRSEIRVLAAS